MRSVVPDDAVYFFGKSFWEWGSRILGIVETMSCVLKIVRKQVLHGTVVGKASSTDVHPKQLDATHGMSNQHGPIPGQGDRRKCVTGFLLVFVYNLKSFPSLEIFFVFDNSSCPELAR